MSDPQGPAIGQEWLDTGDGTKYQWDGSGWVKMESLRDNLIRELVAALHSSLTHLGHFPDEAIEALAKAKAAGYEP